jgi:uncharacterized NAD(P)/FAD-binding protein YdhS
VNALPRTIVIVGAGFTGTAVASNLLRLHHEQPLRIVLIDRSQMARGVAYSKLRYPYLLNVPAGRMSVNSDDPVEFLRVARCWQPAATADDFLPRELYGEYLECSLRSAEEASAPDVELQRTYGQAWLIHRMIGKRTRTCPLPRIRNVVSSWHLPHRETAPLYERPATAGDIDSSLEQGD